MSEQVLKRQLLSRPRWLLPGHPVYRMEVSRLSRSRVVVVLQRLLLPLFLGVAGLAAILVILLSLASSITYSAENAITNTLTILVVVFTIFQLLAGSIAGTMVVAQTAPLISGEVELQSWGLLRTTTLPLREIILAKLAAVLRLLSGALVGLALVRVATTITGWLLLVFSLLRNMVYYNTPSLSLIVRGGYYDVPTYFQVLRSGTWIPLAFAVLLFTVWYLAQPLVQTLINGLIGMLASTLTRSRARAAVGALVGRLTLWFSSILLNVALIFGLFFVLFDNWFSPYYAPIRFFRNLTEPSIPTQVLVTGVVALIYVLAVIGIQSGLIVVMLNVIQSRARKLGM